MQKMRMISSLEWCPGVMHIEGGIVTFKFEQMGGVESLERVLSRREATLKWFEERMKGEELNRVNIYNFYLPIMAIEKLPIDGEWAYV